jgi:CheY-specific phosphatase CheX
VRSGTAEGLYLASRMLGASEDDVTESDVIATCQELANLIAGRVQNALAHAGLSARIGLPVSIATGEGAATVTPNHIVTSYRRSGGPELLTVTLAPAEIAKP